MGNAVLRSVRSAQERERREQPCASRAVTARARFDRLTLVGPRAGFGVPELYGGLFLGHPSIWKIVARIFISGPANAGFDPDEFECPRSVKSRRRASASRMGLDRAGQPARPDPSTGYNCGALRTLHGAGGGGEAPKILEPEPAIKETVPTSAPVWVHILQDKLQIPPFYVLFRGRACYRGEPLLEPSAFCPLGYVFPMVTNTMIMIIHTEVPSTHHHAGELPPIHMP